MRHGADATAPFVLSPAPNEQHFSHPIEDSGQQSRHQKVLSGRPQRINANTISQVKFSPCTHKVGIGGRGVTSYPLAGRLLRLTAPCIGIQRRTCPCRRASNNKGSRGKTKIRKTTTKIAGRWCLPAPALLIGRELVKLRAGISRFPGDWGLRAKSCALTRARVLRCACRKADSVSKWGCGGRRFPDGPVRRACAGVALTRRWRRCQARPGRAAAALDHSLRRPNQQRQILDAPHEFLRKLPRFQRQ